MKKQATLVLAVLLVFAIFAGTILAHSNNDQQGRDHMGGQRHGHMGGSFLEEEISEEEINIRREILRKTEKMQALREEYRELLLAEAPEEELTALEDEILALQEEQEAAAIDEFRVMMSDEGLRDSAAWTGSRGMMGFGGMMGSPGMMGSRGMMGTRDARDRPGLMHTIINSEFEFLIHMIPHHEEAVSTARIMRENTDREEMRDFADEIIITQTEEIEKMNAWLEERYPQRDHDFDYQPMMRDFSGLEGEELDRAFLEDMIFHHMEAVMTSQQLLSRGLAESEEVAALARDIINAQREEIFMMRNWLSSWYEGEQVIGRGHLGRRWQERDFTADRELTEEDISQIRETQRAILRNQEEIGILREEYRRQLLAEASEEELAALEDEIIELQMELEQDRLRLQEQEGFSGRGFRTRHGDFFGTGTHCW